MTKSWLAPLLLLLASCGGGGGGDGAPALPQGAAPQRIAAAIASANTGFNYGLQVYLPAGHATSATRYPVVYAMDAEWRFTVLADVLERENRPVILVAVNNEGSARRWVDFTMPGAEAYYRFLVRELAPMVEATYRGDPARRVLAGHSLSAELAIYALYFERPDNRQFSAFVAEEGPYWYLPTQVFAGSPTTAQPAAGMEAEMFARNPSLPVTLFMAGDARANGPRVRQLYEHFAQRNYPGMRLAHGEYNLGHLPMDGPAFGAALQFVFGPP